MDRDAVRNPKAILGKEAIEPVSDSIVDHFDSGKGDDEIGNSEIWAICILGIAFPIYSRTDHFKITYHASPISRGELVDLAMNRFIKYSLVYPGVCRENKTISAEPTQISSKAEVVWRPDGGGLGVIIMPLLS